MYQATATYQNFCFSQEMPLKKKASEEKNAIDYYPFGMPMPNRQIVGGEPYRYGYQGQEKDPETGKEAFELRLWDGRIGRWLTKDPFGVHHSPYLGMGNNPIILVDPNGGYPTPYEGAVLSAHIYDHSVSLVGGWKLSSRTDFNRDNTRTGLKAALYERVLENGRTEYAYVYAGSVELADWKNNAQQVFGKSEQYADALEVATELSIALKVEELTFVGHSLGGGLANYSSLGTDRSSMTFNPAWVSRASIHKLNNDLDANPPLAFHPTVPQTNYVHRADPLHAFQNGSPAARAALKKIGNTIRVGGDFNSYLNGHSIFNMMNSLRPNRNVTITVGEGSFEFPE